jgi:hypothetical protein
VNKGLCAGATLALALPLALAACSEGLLSDLDRPARNPGPQVPAVVSFESELSVTVTWRDDDAADSYVLERAPDGAVPVYQAVHIGRATRFVDAQCEDQVRYLYRLLAVRGRRSFGPWGAALGVASGTCRDALESNDSEESATPLEYDRSANIFFYRSFGGDVVEDIDWYAIEVPPRRQANVVITQVNPAPGGLATALVFYLKGSVPVPVTNSQAIAIANPSNARQTLVFRVSVDADEVISDPLLAGGATIDYTVSLASIVGL